MRNRSIKMSFYLINIVVLVSTFLLTLNVIGKTYRYSIGDIAREDIRVPGDIKYNIDSETTIEKRRIAETVPIVFDRDHSVLIEKLRLCDMLFDNMDSVMREIPPSGTGDRTFHFITLKKRLQQYILLDDVVLFNLLRHPDPGLLRNNLKRVLIYVLDSGVLDKTYGNPLNIPNRNVTPRILNSGEESPEVSRTIESLKTIEEVRWALYGIARSLSPELLKEDLGIVHYLARSLLVPNVRFNAEETKRRIDLAMNRVKPVTGLLKKGQTIAREGDTVTTESLEKISILNSYTKSSRLNYLIGILLIQVSFLGIFGYFLLEYHSSLLPNSKSPFIIFSIVMVFIVYTFFLSRAGNIMNDKTIFALYLPLPAVTMLVATLFNMFIAIIVGLYAVFFSFLITGGSVPVILVAFSSAIIGVFILRDVEKRTGFLRGGLILGLVNSIIVTGVCLLEEYTFYTTLTNIELAVASGIVNSMLVLGVFPVFENLFRIVTKFNLLELSDLNAPIFKRMLIKAPGTYNHSLMVANMAEAACKEIGANYLLARVGGYYHDIGKIDDAGIYIENKITDKRAKLLTPQEYSGLIISHVEKGVALASKYGLPEPVIDYIKEHHGTTVMTYFYHQALEMADTSGESVDVAKSDFRYPGPKPRSRETAVVMLADSIEAASRSLQEPTYVKLESLVKKIIYNKLNDDELEYSDLTMSDLSKIQNAFMRILNGIFHTRIEYPDKEELEKLEQKVLNRENGN
jgi:cyclic-di-AMP phosphodiesterase PgpH